MDLGLHYTLDDTTSKLDPEVLAIQDAVNPTLSNAFGKVWDLFGQRAAPFTTDEFVVLGRAYTVPEVTVTAAGSADTWDHISTATGLPVSSGTIDRLTVGDVLLVEDEIVVVKSIDRSANTIAVYERGAGETTGARHGTGALTAKIIGNANIEGTVDVTAKAEATGTLTNYLQLVEEKVDLSYEDSEQARKLGQTEPILKGEAMTRVMQKLANTAIHGVAVAPSKTLPGMTRGMIQWMKLASGLKEAVSGAFDEPHLQSAFQAIRLAGGNANAIVMSPSKKATLNGFSSADVVSEDVTHGTLGRQILNYNADGFGVVPVIVDKDMPDSVVAIVNSNKMSKGWKGNDSLRFENEPGNSRQRLQTLQGKFGLAMEGIGTDHYLLYGLS